MSSTPDRSSTNDLVLLQRAGTINDCMARYGLRRSAVYKLAKLHPHILKRVLGRSLVDFCALDALFERMPNYQEAPHKTREHLVNMPETGKVSRTVRAARAKRQAKAEAAKSAAS